MSEANKTVVRRYFEEVLAARNLDAASAFVSVNYANHSLAHEDVGFVGLRRRIEKLHEAFPDVQIELADLIAENDRVVARWTMQGTHQGVFNGGLFNRLEPTGRAFTMTAITIFRVENGEILECWNERDRLGRLHQLGLLPAALHQEDDATEAESRTNAA